MKKTTWVIIGLSICVVVLATTLGIVLLQQKTETIIARTLNLESSGKISSELRQMIDSFYISPFRPNDALYFDAEAYIKSHPENVVIVPGRLKDFQSIKVTTYAITKEK